MPQIVASDTVLRMKPGETPDYNSANPLMKLLALAERQRLAAERSYYLTDDLQALVPFDHLDLVGPQGGDADILDPARQDNKSDFQKQNVRDFTIIVRYQTLG